MPNYKPYYPWDEIPYEAPHLHRAPKKIMSHRHPIRVNRSLDDDPARAKYIDEVCKKLESKDSVR